MPKSLLAIFFLLLPITLCAAEPNGVAIEPSKTSIYVGSVTLTPTAMNRTAGGFSGTYTAKVFPFFFESEAGAVKIDATGTEIARLAAGEAVDFKGSATAENGDPRRLEGHATPTGPDTGRIKIRIFVSRRIELIFNSTYRFTFPSSGK